jgi:hypothetical protein
VLWDLEGQVARDGVPEEVSDGGHGDGEGVDYGEAEHLQTNPGVNVMNAIFYEKI